MILQKILFGLTTIFSSFAVGAGSADNPPSHIYLNHPESAYIHFLPAPPKENSDQDKADFDKVFEFQKTRTPMECEKAIADAHFNFKEFFGSSQNLLPDSKLAIIDPLILNANKDARYITFQLKDHFKRPRPFISHSEIKPCTDRENSFSFPSGHASLSRWLAKVLSYVDPENAAKYMARADEIALLRVKGGVHYPSDIAAGKILGDQLYDDLMKSPKFKKELDQVKARFHGF